MDVLSILGMRIDPPGNATPGQLIDFVFQGLEQIHSNSSSSFQWKPVLAQVLRRKLPFTPEQIERMVRLASMEKTNFPYRGILKAAEAVPMTAALAEALLRMKGCVDDYYLGGPESRAIHERVDTLVAPMSPGGAPPTPELTPSGAWSQAVLHEMAQHPSSSAWTAIFLHAADLKQGEPSKKWLREAETLVDTVGRDGFREAALRWLDLGPAPGQTGVQLDGKEAELLKGFLWLLTGFPDAAMASGIARFAEGCLKKIPMLGAVSQKAGNACVNVLAAMGTMDAVAQLSRLARRVRYDTAQRLIEKALEEAAQRARLSRDEMEEMTVPEADAIDDSPKGRKERDALVAAHRLRIERLMMTQRAIPVEKWRTCYLHQSLLSDLARRLIWVFETPAGSQLGIWYRDHLVDDTERELALPEGSTVRLWHPISSNVETILFWRCWLEDRGIQQPFKQAHREVYLLTPAERETYNYSNRFGGHIVRQHQFQALCQNRGWKFRLMGEFDSHNTPELDLAAWGLRVTLDVEFPHTPSVTHHMIYVYIETGRVTFYDQAGLPQPLESIPAAVFSEVMRDVDLFAGVSSIGMIPEWGQAPALNPFPDYWQKFAFGDLGAGAESRRDLLGRLLPKLAIASRCRLEGRFLAVRGDRATYRIHLGSGSVLMEPGSRYLCIVQGASKKGDARSVRLPFEGDETLSLILSKAFLLANDRQIREPGVLAQLPPISNIPAERDSTIEI